MPGYRQYFVVPVGCQLICPLCRLPMREPVVVINCSHSFCDSCLDSYLSKGVQSCPVDKVPIDYAKAFRYTLSAVVCETAGVPTGAISLGELTTALSCIRSEMASIHLRTLKIYPDEQSKSDIMTSLVRCTRYKDGCQWVDQLQHVQAHMEVCYYKEKSSLKCPNECGTTCSTRTDLDSHVKCLCPRRRAVCDSCTIEFTGDDIDTHRGNCPMEVVWCDNKCGAQLPRRHLSNHRRNDCHKRTVSCMHCRKQFVHETLQDHYYQCNRFPMTCPNRCESGKIAREDIEAHVTRYCQSAVVPCPFREIGCKYVGTRNGMEAHHTISTSAHLSLVCSLAISQQRVIADLTDRLAAISTSQTAPDGSFIWRVKGFSSKAGMEVKSAAFYIFPHGYRLSASMFPTGNGSGEGSHLSVYMRLLPGDYDPVLDWPFRSPITVTVMDQSDGVPTSQRTDLVESFTPNSTWKQFQRPLPLPGVKDHLRSHVGVEGTVGSGGSSQSAGWFGYPRFVALDVLRSSDAYIKDDTIFVKFKAEQWLI